jgi:Ni/Fe-hydrogenase 1 B-type cytochrome subunit
MTAPSLKSYAVWDRTTRVFHWLNFLSILVLIAAGVVILNAKALGVPSAGKILLKTVHVYAGYVFVVNLAWRLVWAFIGGPFARWRALLPFGNGFGTALGAYVRGEKTAYMGHSPLGRLSVTALLIVLSVQAVTGLVLAGTDIYFPPFGGWITAWIAAPGVDPASLVPYAKDMLDPEAYQEMRAFRKPYIQTHYATFYVIIGLITVHIAAVVRSEVKLGGGLVSAMFTGKKTLASKPEDESNLD